MTRDVRVVYGCHHPTDDRPGVEIQTPFEADFVEDLKGAIPWKGRTWDPERKVWWVSGDYAQQAEDLVVHHFGETIVVDEGGESYRDESGVTARQERLL